MCCHSTASSRQRRGPASALLSYIMPVFRQSGRAFAAGVSVRPKWLCPESFAASSRAEDSSGGGGGSSISCSLELALTVHSGQVPARLQTNKQSKRQKLSFFFPSLLQQKLCTVHLALYQLYALHSYSFALALTGTDVAFGAGASQRLLYFFFFVVVVFLSL